MLSVGCHGIDAPLLSADKLLLPMGQHGIAKVQGKDLVARMVLSQCKGDVQGACRKIQEAVGSTSKDGFGKNPAPVAVDPQGKHVIEQIVETRDAAEHAGNGLIVRADGSVAHGPLVPLARFGLGNGEYGRVDHIEDGGEHFGDVALGDRADLNEL